MKQKIFSLLALWLVAMGAMAVDFSGEPYATLGNSTNSGFGTFSGADDSHKNMNTSWIWNTNSAFTISATSTDGTSDYPERFSRANWGSPAYYGFCTNNAKLTLNVSAEFKVEGLEIVGQSTKSNGTDITVGEGLTLGSTTNISNTEFTTVQITVNDPTYGQSVTFSAGNQMNCYIKVYGSFKTYQIEDPLVFQFAGTTAGYEGTFSGADDSHKNMNTLYTSNTTGYSIAASNPDGTTYPGRFSGGYWTDSNRTYGFCVKNAALTINVPSNIRVQAIEVVGQSGTATITGTDGYAVLNNKTALDGTQYNSVIYVVKEPVLGKAISLSISDNQSNIYFKLYGSYIVTTNADGWASFSASQPVVFSGATAYYGSNYDSNKLTLKKCTDNKVPANEGVFVKGEANTTYTATLTESAEAITGNKIKAILDPETGHTVVSDETAYALATVGSEAGLYKVATDVTIKSRAYVSLPASPNAKQSLVFSFDDETTAINQIENGEMRMENYSGKYIKDGRIVIVKDGKMFNLNGQEVR